MRKRQFRLQRFPEACERCRCVHDVHSCFKCTTFLNSRFASGCCVSVVFLHVGTGRCGEQVDVLRGLDVSDFLLFFHRPRSPVCCSVFFFRMLVLHHLCSVVVKGTSGVFDSSAADPGAARCLSMVTSAIDETVTPLKERIFFLTVLATPPVE